MLTRTGLAQMQQEPLINQINVLCDPSSIFDWGSTNLPKIGAKNDFKS
jgi:hypothetical protein